MYEKKTVFFDFKKKRYSEILRQKKIFDSELMFV